MDQLAGDVVLFAVPAEEMIEIDYRNKLREQGKLKYMGGKQQLIYEGDVYKRQLVYSEEEIRMMISRSHEEGQLDQVESELIDNVFNFVDRMAKEVMRCV